MATGAFENLVTGSDIKNVYPNKRIQAMLNKDIVFRPWLKAQVPAGATHSAGGILKFNARLGEPQNVGVTVDVGTLAPAKERTSTQMTIYPKIFTGAMQIGIMTMAAANNNKAAFNGGEKMRRTEETVDDLGKFVEQMYVGQAGDGVIAIVESDGSGYFVAANSGPARGVKYCRTGRLISVRQTAAGSVRDSVDAIQITSVDEANRYVYYDITSGTWGTGADKTLVAGDYVYTVVETTQTLTQSSGNGPFPNGLFGLVDDGTYNQYIHGVDRTSSTNLRLKSNVDSNGGVLRNLTEKILNKAALLNHERSGKRVTDAWMGPGQELAYANFVAPDRRAPFTGGQEPKYSTGYADPSTSFNHYAPGTGKITFHLSYDCMPRDLYLVNADCFFLYTATPLEWWGEGGSVLKPIPGTSAYKGGYVAYMHLVENIGCDLPNGCTVIRDLADETIGDSV